MVRKSPQDKKNKQFFSAKLNELLSLNNKKQIDLHKDLGIPKSTITGYVKGTSLPTMGNLQKIADYFNVLKSDIDLRFKNKEDFSNDSLQLHLISNFSQLENERKQKVVEYSSEQLKQQNKGTKTSDSSIKETMSVYSEGSYACSIHGIVSADTGEVLKVKKQVRLSIKPPKHDLALCVTGNKMEPLFDDNQVIFISKLSSKDLSELTHRFALIELNSTQYLKKIVVRSNHELHLVSLDKNYHDTPITQNDDFAVKGVVVL